MKRVIIVAAVLLMNSAVISAFSDRYADNAVMNKTLTEEKNEQSSIISDIEGIRWQRGGIVAESVEEIPCSEYELGRIAYLAEKYRTGSTEPYIKMSARKDGNGLYYDRMANIVIFPEREMTDEEILSYIDFMEDIGNVLAMNGPRPEVYKYIDAEAAVNAARAAAEHFFEADLSGCEASAGFNEVGEETQWDVQLTYREIVYHIQVGSEQGRILGLEYHTANTDSDENSGEINYTDMEQFRTEAAQALSKLNKNVVNTILYVPRYNMDSICAMCETDSGEYYEVTLSYPSAERKSCFYFDDKSGADSFIQKKAEKILE